MYDARAYDQPQWLKNRFVDKHTEVIENTIDAQPYLLRAIKMSFRVYNLPLIMDLFTRSRYYEVYSAPFEPGTVCLGGNDADGVIENYWVLVGPDEWKPYDPRSTVVYVRPLIDALLTPY